MENQIDRGGWEYTRLRTAAIERLGGVCAHCGFTDVRALQVDHKDGKGYIERRRKGRTSVYTQILNGRTKNYQLLCANCNVIKARENGEYRGRPGGLDLPGQNGQINLLEIDERDESAIMASEWLRKQFRF